MRYRLVIFDFDGTLADSFPFLVSVMNALAERHGLRQIEPSEVATLRSWELRRILKHVGLPLWKLPLVMRSVSQMMAESIERIRLFDGIPELLAELRQRGILLAVVSSNSEQNVRRVLGPANAALVSDYECGAAVFGKRARLRRVARHSGLAPAEILCIGDETRDIDAARAEGMTPAAVSWGYAHPALLAARQPAQLFASPAEIAAFLA